MSSEGPSLPAMGELAKGEAWMKDSGDLAKGFLLQACRPGCVTHGPEGSRGGPGLPG